MALARLLTAALLFSSLPAFAQDQPTADRQASIKTDRYRFDGAATPSEPWKIFQAPPANLSSDSKHRIQVDRYHFDQGNIDFRTNHSWIVAKPDTLITSLDGDPGADTTCFTIRSYVVARDSKDSDSTHLTGYSTCQRASRYRLKTTIERQVLLTR